MSIGSLDNHAGAVKRSRIPLLFFAFFAVVIAANATMIWIALSSWTGLETRNHYLKGVDYNSTLRDVQAQDALGWSVASKILPTDRPGRFRIDVTLADDGAAPIVGAKVVVRLERPTHHGVDIRTDLMELSNGRYGATVDIPIAGQWNVRRLVWFGTETHQTVERVFLKPDAFQ
ncbi:MAG: FixH family protein [Alphaproteobacteria bacterium]|nr:FixH family protein [Alphaproteobacteria bacterium]